MRCAWALAWMLVGCAPSLTMQLRAQTQAQRPLAQDDDLRSGEAFTLTVELERPAFLYLLHQDPAGKLTVLARRGRCQGVVVLPAERLDAVTGRETAIVVASRTELSDEALVAAAARPVERLAAADKKRPRPAPPPPPPPCHPKQPQDCYRGPEPLRVQGRGLVIGRFTLNHR